MGQSGPPDPSSPAGGSDERLDSWKEIAAYLRRDVTTVQRWEKREGMPVHRHLHDKMGSVFALRAELDAWMQTRHASVPTEPAPTSNASAGLQTSALPGIGRSGGPAGDSQASTAGEAARLRPRGFSAVWLAALAAAVLASLVTMWLLDGGRPANAIDNARFVRLTDFPGSEESAALSPDGRFVAFLSDRDGRFDVWLTQVGTGHFSNLTQGSVDDIVNRSVRALGFSPDGAFVTFWRNHRSTSGAPDIGVWMISILGGQPRPYLEGVAEFDWSSDGARLVYHTPAEGDPTFLRGAGQSADRQVFVAGPGLHSHFPEWSPDDAFIYFVQGALPDRMDIWRVPASRGPAERITHHDSRVSHPVFVDERTVLYLATDGEGSGPWLHSVDVEQRSPRRVTPGVERFTSLAAAADGRRLVATESRPRHTFWRVPLGPSVVDMAAATPVSLATGSASSPRFGPDYLAYVVSGDAGDAVWTLRGGVATEVWRADGAEVIGGPAVSPDGEWLAFSVRRAAAAILFVVRTDGTGGRVVADSLALHGTPAWAPDGRSLTSAVHVGGSPRLFNIPLDGSRPLALLATHSEEPVWARDGSFVLYSGADIGTTFSVNAASPDGDAHQVPALDLTRGGRQIRFLHQEAIVVMRGEIDHKNLWLVDLATGAERQLTDLPQTFNLRSFDISQDGRELVLERAEEQSDIVLIDLAPR